MMTFKICNLLIASEYCPLSFAAFRAEGAADMTITLTDAPFPAGRSVAEHPDFSVYLLDGGWLYQTPRGEQLAVTKGYDRAALWLPHPFSEERVLLLLRIAIECRLARQGVISLHSACVIQGGRAVAFTGVSGMGKSTRAGQWVKALDARWLSGDRPAVCVENAAAYGVPWDGKEQLFRNASGPLAAVLEVRRGSFTRLRRLTRAQARRVLMSQCFLPMWDSDTAARIMDLIGTAARTIAVCRLFCDMDEAAARETYQMVYQKQESILSEEIDLKIKEGFVLRRLVGEYMVMPTGDNVAKFEGSVALNEVAAFVFEKLCAPVSREDLLALLCAEYDVQPEIAGRDLDALLDAFRSYGMLQEQA